MKKFLLALLMVVMPLSAYADFVQFTGFEEGDRSGIQSASGSNLIACTTTVPSMKVRTGLCSGRIAVQGSGSVNRTGNYRLGGVASTGGYTASLHKNQICATGHINFDNFPASGSEQVLLFLDDATGATKASVEVGTTGLLSLYDSTGALIGTGSHATSIDAWSRITADICTGSSCTSTVYVGGVSDISGSGNFGTNPHGSQRWGMIRNSNTTMTFYYDDLIANDSTCQGNVRVKRIPVTGDGALAQWVPNTGVDLFPKIAEWPVDATTYVPYTAGNYIRSTKSGFPEFATFNVDSDSGDAPTGAILSVKVHAYVRKAPGETGEEAFGIIIRNNEFEFAGGTDDEIPASDQAMTGRGLLRNTDPYTGAQWQPDGVQSMEIGVYENNNVYTDVYAVQAYVAYDPTASVPTPTPAPTYVPPTPAAAPYISSYPGATGYGIAAPVGSGRQAVPSPAPGEYGSITVYTVTNLNSSGAGSLTACLIASGPRACIFEVSGYIDLPDSVVISNPYLTVYGQTAPEPGIHIRNSRLDIKTHDVLLQHFSIRPADGFPGGRLTERDALVMDSSSGNPVYNIHLNHMTFAYGLDENVSTYAGSSILYPLDNINISENLIYQGLNNSVRGTYFRGCNKAVCDANPTVCTQYCASPPCGQCTDYKVPHGKDMILDKTTRISIHENIMAESEDRHPRIKPGTEMEFYNNYVYGWAGDSTWQMMNCAGTAGGAACKLSIAGNYYRRAPYSQIAPILYYDSTIPVLSRAFMSHNICPTRPLDVSSEWLCSNWPQAWQVFSPPILESGVQIKLPNDTVAYTLANAGPRKWNRWIGDQQVLDDIIAGTGKIRDCISGCTNEVFPGGWPTIVPATRALTPPPVPNFVESNGRTAIENYAFSFNEDGNPHYTPEPTPAGTATPSGATPTPTPIATWTARPTRTPTPNCD